MGNEVTADFLIVGAGIMGLALAREIRVREPAARIGVVEKEPVPAWHASGRNSGVFHAGFSYTSDSLKALFTREGNRLWRDYCREKGDTSLTSRKYCKSCDDRNGSLGECV